MLYSRGISRWIPKQINFTTNCIRSYRTKKKTEEDSVTGEKKGRKTKKEDSKREKTKGEDSKIDETRQEHATEDSKVEKTKEEDSTVDKAKQENATTEKIKQGEAEAKAEAKGLPKKDINISYNGPKPSEPNQGYGFANLISAITGPSKIPKEPKQGKPEAIEFPQTSRISDILGALSEATSAIKDRKKEVHSPNTEDYGGYDRFDPRLLQILRATIPDFVPARKLSSLQKYPKTEKRIPLAPSLDKANLFQKLVDRAAAIPLAPHQDFLVSPVDSHSEGQQYRFPIKSILINKSAEVYEQFARHSENFHKPDWPLLDYLGLPERVVVERTAPVPQLQNGLGKVLFSPGVHPLRDLVTGEFKFSPHLYRIHQPHEINYKAIPPFITSSKDATLQALAEEYGCLYKGSTSSVSPILAQFYYLLSEHKVPNMSSLSANMQQNGGKFTKMSRKSVAVVLRPSEKGVLSIDSDPGNVVASNQILLDLGKSLERMVTMSTEDYTGTTLKIEGEAEQEQNLARECYFYVQKGPFLLRSQQDCAHPGINGDRKVFDLKSRATYAVRFDCQNFEQAATYKINSLMGEVNSYEREYYDMVRAAFAKYYFQVRIGHMAGIFVTYHSTKEIFGFEYIPREELENSVFGNSIWASKSYEITLQLLYVVLEEIKARSPGSVRVLFKAEKHRDSMDIFVEELAVDEGWREPAHATSSNVDLSNMSATQKRAAQVELITNKVRWYVLKLAKFVNGLKVEPFDYTPGDNLEIFYNFEEQPQTYDVVLESYAQVLRDNGSFKEFD